MAINFPTSLDNLSNPTSSTEMNDPVMPHSTQHANLNDIVEALEAKVGVDNSTVVTSLDYRINAVENAGLLDETAHDALDHTGLTGVLALGTTGTTACAGNDSRLSDARTPTSHNNTAHSETYVVSGGALGTPSSGTVTNLTGTASININGTVGATTPAAGTFTSLSASGNTTLGDAAGDTTTFPDLKALQVTTPSRASIRPSLLLDFANSKTLDPRITYTRASTATYYDGKTVAKAEENLFLNSATLATQSVTCTATAYTLSFYGTGTVTLTGASTAGPLVGTGATDRVVLTFTPTAGSVTFTVSGTVTNAQLEARSSGTAYTPTTTQPITNYIPQLMTAASDVPRFDHNPTTGESLGLLIEESRANLLTYSEDFSQSVWAKTRVSIVSDTVVAPDGMLTGDKLFFSTDNNTHILGRSSLASAAYTFSVYAKAAEETTFSMWLRSAAAGATFNLSAGTVSLQGVTSAAITPVGNGWYRCSVYDSTAGTTAAIYGRNGSAFAGDGFSGIYIWGAQLEAGAFPTSYIKTEAAQVTRAADAASMTGKNFSSWYRQDQGSLFSESQTLPQAGNNRVFVITDATPSNNLIGVSAHTTSGNAGLVNANGVGYTNFTSTIVSGQPYKIALAYKANDVGFTVSGATTQTDTSAIIPVVDRVCFGSNGSQTGFGSGTIRKIAYYPARLTNAELQGLTTP